MKIVAEDFASKSQFITIHCVLLNRRRDSRCMVLSNELQKSERDSVTPKTAYLPMYLHGRYVVRISIRRMCVDST